MEGGREQTSHGLRSDRADQDGLHGGGLGPAASCWCLCIRVTCGRLQIPMANNNGEKEERKATWCSRRRPVVEATRKGSDWCLGAKGRGWVQNAPWVGLHCHAYFTRYSCPICGSKSKPKSVERLSRGEFMICRPRGCDSSEAITDPVKKQARTGRSRARHGCSERSLIRQRLSLGWFRPASSECLALPCRPTFPAHGDDVPTGLRVAATM